MTVSGTKDILIALFGVGGFGTLFKWYFARKMRESAKSAATDSSVQIAAINSFSGLTDAYKQAIEEMRRHGREQDKRIEEMRSIYERRITKIERAYQTMRQHYDRAVRYIATQQSVIKKTNPEWPDPPAFPDFSSE